MKTVVHSIRPGPGENTFLIELTWNGETRTFTAKMHPKHESMQIEEDGFGDFCRGNIGLGGKLVALVARVRRKEDVAFPVEIDGSRRGGPAS